MIAPAVRLEMCGLSKRFGGVVALEDVNLSVLSGEVHAIVGENGAGKSTLMRIVSGAISDYQGQLVLNGRPVRFSGPGDAEQQGVSVIYQELALVGHLSASANIFLGRESRCGPFLSNRAMDRQAAQYFGLLGAQIRPRARVTDLRAADRQLVEIAKALSLDADLVIMDEPTSALADPEVARLFGVIAALKAQGVTILYISHKMDEVFQVADRITVLRDGRHMATLASDQTSAEAVIRLMVGRDISSRTLEQEPISGQELLRVRDLSLVDRDQPGVRKLDRVSFQLHVGEILGVAGLLGAGRTELLECLFGASAHAPAGRIWVKGQPCQISSPREAIRLGIAMVTEDRQRLGLFPALSVAGNITIANLFQAVRGLLLSKRKENELAEDQVARLGIRTAGTGARIASLSGGNQQKCVLARALLTRPAILLLDEPTRGIDVAAKADVYRLLRQMCRLGIGVVMTSSDLPELLSVCDRIIVLCEGRKTGEFPRTGATEEKIMQAAMVFRRPSPSRGEPAPGQCRPGAGYAAGH